MKLWPGAIGHCDIDGAPSYHGVFCIRSPCQCIAVPSGGFAIRLCTVTWIVSPQFASMVGPGNCPLTKMTFFSMTCESSCTDMGSENLTNTIWRYLASGHSEIIKTSLASERNMIEVCALCIAPRLIASQEISKGWSLQRSQE